MKRAEKSISDIKPEANEARYTNTGAEGRSGREEDISVGDGGAGWDSSEDWHTFVVKVRINSHDSTTPSPPPHPTAQVHNNDKNYLYFSLRN